MHPNTALHLILSLPALASASALLAPRATCGETSARVCFGKDGGHVQYAADYLRYLGDSNTGLEKMWRMPAAVGDCAEWEIPIDYPGSVLVLAKHIVPRYATSVLFEDIAKAIDGGVDASDSDKAKSLLGACGTGGGMVGVAPNDGNAEYKSTAFVNSKAKNTGLLIKVVKNPNA
jgi:hypothetical protein